MALIRMTYELSENKMFMRILDKTYDSVEFVRDDRASAVYVFRVTGEGVPDDDTVICPEVCSFDGVEPLIISHDA